MKVEIQRRFDSAESIFFHSGIAITTHRARIATESVPAPQARHHHALKRMATHMKPDESGSTSPPDCQGSHGFAPPGIVSLPRLWPGVLRPQERAYGLTVITLLRAASS